MKTTDRFHPPEMPPVAFWQYDDVCRQRDELAKACEALRAAYQIVGGISERGKESAWLAMEAALAAVKEK